MKIEKHVDPVSRKSGKIEFVLGDKGSAFVSLNLLIKKGEDVLFRLDHDKTYKGDLARTLTIDPETYRCTLLISAYREDALGPNYDSYLKISDESIATAKGIIPDGVEPDYDSVNFDLIVS